MATNDREAAGREAYEANLRDSGITAQANAVRWDSLDDATRQRWIDQAAEEGEPAESGAEKPVKATKSAPVKATKSAGAKADGDSV
jgi:hypothetical protein